MEMVLAFEAIIVGPDDGGFAGIEFSGPPALDMNTAKRDEVDQSAKHDDRFVLVCWGCCEAMVGWLIISGRSLVKVNDAFHTTPSKKSRREKHAHG